MEWKASCPNSSSPTDWCLPCQKRFAVTLRETKSVTKQGGGGGIGFRCRDCKCDYTLHPPLISRRCDLSALAGRLGFQLIDPNPVAGLIFSERHACSAVLACADVRAHPINTLRPRWNTFFSRWQLTSIDISTGLWSPCSGFLTVYSGHAVFFVTSIKRID